MKTKDINEELKRFNQINKYAKKLIIEQEPPLPGEETPVDPSVNMGEPTDMPETPPEGAEEFSMTGDTETSAEISPETAHEDDETEELDITDLVNMTKSIKKQLDDQPKAETGAIEKMDDIFTKLNDLETKLSDMDNILNRIDQIGNEIEQMKPKTPVEKLEMRSLDSYPFNKKPDEFFAEKTQQMRDSGKNEYILTKDEIENYGKNQIMKSFNPKASENDYMF